MQAGRVRMAGVAGRTAVPAIFASGFHSHLTSVLLEYNFQVAHYSKEIYNGTFEEYLLDSTVPDPGLRCGYAASSLLIESINASEVLLPVMLWVSDKSNSSMMLMLETAEAELGGGVLRPMTTRITRVDYIMPIWLFSVGFTYLAERESSSNMYVEPFTAAVWGCCLVVGVTLALALWLTSRNMEEREGAFMAVLATWLQQDASAVPSSLSGRWTFTVLSVCSMLVHAYYTSAIVSALMSSGRGGPRTLTQLADSRYAIASDDHDFIRSIMFDVKTNWTDLEYLKKKKVTPKFYQDIKYGVQLVQQGYTAYHAEYHQLYPYLNILSDPDICKMQHVDTIPEISSDLQMMSWVTAARKGQYTNLLRIAGAWLQETGHAKRLISRMRIQPPPCRAAMLAERVTFWDVMPLLGLTALAAVTSFCLLGLEILVAKWRRHHSYNV
ncbi:hypothetical protein evm_001368 [Chilo suppressalis]|nr:hypothetical protein evm_001368 [Chilo suppressalis]